MEDGLDGDTKQVAPFEPKSIHVLHWMHVDRIHISPLSLSVRRGIPFCFFLTETLSLLRLTSIFTLGWTCWEIWSNYELFLHESIKSNRIKRNARGRLTLRWCEMQIIQTHFLKVVFCEPHGGYAIALKHKTDSQINRAR